MVNRDFLIQIVSATGDLTATRLSIAFRIETDPGLKNSGLTVFTGGAAVFNELKRISAFNKTNQKCCRAHAAEGENEWSIFIQVCLDAKSR